MEMRKFIIERHPDGKMTWCEYEEPVYSVSANYKAGAQDAYNTIINILEKRKKKIADIAISYKFRGDQESWRKALLDCESTDECIVSIKNNYNIK